MPATGLKIVGTGERLPWCSISSSFQNSLKMSGHRGYEFWCWNLVPFLPDIGFQLLKSLWSSDVFFCLMMPQMFSIGERSGLQAGQFSTQTFLLQSHAVVIAAECSFALSYWNTCCLDLYTPFSIHIAFENMQAAHTVCTYAAPYHQRCWLLCVWPAAISSCSPRLVTHWR